MRIGIPYLDRELELEVPDGNLLALAEPNEIEGGSLPSEELVRDAVGSPLDCPPLSEFLAASERLLVIVNDGTRPTPTAAVLDAVGDELEAASARFIVATGAHRAPTEEEYRQILGRHYERFRKRIEAHDARGQGQPRRPRPHPQRDAHPPQSRPPRGGPRRRDRLGGASLLRGLHRRPQSLPSRGRGHRDD